MSDSWVCDMTNWTYSSDRLWQMVTNHGKSNGDKMFLFSVSFSFVLSWQFGVPAKLVPWWWVVFTSTSNELCGNVNKYFPNLHGNDAVLKKGSNVHLLRSPEWACFQAFLRLPKKFVELSLSVICNSRWAVTDDKFDKLFRHMTNWQP